MTHDKLFIQLVLFGPFPFEQHRPPPLPSLTQVKLGGRQAAQLLSRHPESAVRNLAKLFLGVRKECHETWGWWEMGRCDDVT